MMTTTMTAMAKTMKWWMALPVAALTLGLTACGGDGGDDDGPDGGEQASIRACFTVDRTVNFAVESFNVPAGTVFPNRITAGPMTYNGQMVTGQTAFYPSGSTINTQSSYWVVANNGVTMIAAVINDSTVVLDGTFLPENMIPNQTATNSSNEVTTFLRFEEISLGGRVFLNTCHITAASPSGVMNEAWYAPGYGLVKQVAPSGSVMQYARDI